MAAPRAKKVPPLTRANFTRLSANSLCSSPSPPCGVSMKKYMGSAYRIGKGLMWTARPKETAARTIASVCSP